MTNNLNKNSALNFAWVEHKAKQHQIQTHFQQTQGNNPNNLSNCTKHLIPMSTKTVSEKAYKDLTGLWVTGWISRLASWPKDCCLSGFMVDKDTWEEFKYPRGMSNKLQGFVDTWTGFAEHLRAQDSLCLAALAIQCRATLLEAAHTSYRMPCELQGFVDIYIGFSDTSASRIQQSPWLISCGDPLAA